MRRALPLAVLAVGWTVFPENASAAPAGQEPVVAETRSVYPSEWPPGPAQSSVPDWASPGTFSFMRWDGGPIETAKAFLSGWPGMNPPIPDYVYVTTNWYDPRTIQYLREAHINLIWVTFSNGFSIPTEKVQRDLLRAYIRECHRSGIRVLAYESIENMFWEDMFANVPASRDWILHGRQGQPVPYGAGRYSKVGRITRYMADPSQAGWRDYLMKRIDLAVEAGADGIMYDNVLPGITADTVGLFKQIMEHALRRKPDFLVEVNLHRNDYIFNRLLNCMTTEDGGEPGVFPEDRLPNAAHGGDRHTLLPVGGGFLVNHVGLFRTFEDLSGGWKPAMVESNFRETGNREQDFMRPERQKLAMAEPMMYNVVNEGFVELRFAHDLWRNDPAAVASWKAIGQYNRFFAENRQYYRGARSLAPLAIVLDARSAGQDVLNGLAARNVLYNVLYEDELTPETLKPYAAVALLSAERVRDSALAALDQYVRAGGKLFAAGPAAGRDETGMPRARPDWFGKKHGAGEAVYWPKLPAMDALAGALKAADRPALARVEAPPGVLYNVTDQAASGRTMIHLLNYLPRPVGRIVVSVAGTYGRVELLSPDGPADVQPAVSREGGTTRIELPSLQIYSLLVLTKSHGDKQTKAVGPVACARGGLSRLDAGRDGTGHLSDHRPPGSA